MSQTLVPGRYPVMVNPTAAAQRMTPAGLVSETAPASASSGVCGGATLGHRLGFSFS